MGEDLAAALGAGERPGLRILWAPVDDYCRCLSDRERACVAGAVDKRRREFSTGRWLAHRALAGLDVPARDLLPGPARNPLWPPRTVGSIAHSEQLALVAVGPEAEYRGVGVDLEATRRVGPALVPRILTARERRDFADLDPTLLFSAKEAFFKLAYPIIGRYFDFLDVEIDLDRATRSFRVHLHGDVAATPALGAARGSFATWRRHRVTLLTLERAAGAQGAQRRRA